MTWEGLNPPYRTIVADPPWMYQKNPGAKHDGDLGTGRGGTAERCYTTMTNEQVRDLPVSDLADDEAHLYLWFTNPGMFGGRFSDVSPKAIAEAWGFTFQTVLTWVKGTGDAQANGGGMGWYFRGATEHVLFATRGGLGIPSEKREPNVITARATGHSQKPGALLDLIERVSPGPYVELFARQPRLGWDSWGWGHESVAATG